MCSTLAQGRKPEEAARRHLTAEPPRGHVFDEAGTFHFRSSITASMRVTVVKLPDVVVNSASTQLPRETRLRRAGVRRRRRPTARRRWWEWANWTR